MKTRFEITAKMVTSLDKEVGLERFVPVHILQQLVLVGLLINVATTCFIIHLQKESFCTDLAILIQGCGEYDTVDVGRCVASS